MSNEKAAPIPNGIYKARVPTGKGGVTTETEVVRLSEFKMLAIRFATLTAEVAALKAENAVWARSKNFINDVELKEDNERLEAEIARLQEEAAECDAHEFCLDSDHAQRKRTKSAAELVALKAEIARLSAPVSDAELRRWCGKSESGFYRAQPSDIDNLLEARATPPQSGGKE